MCDENIDEIALTNVDMNKYDSGDDEDSIMPPSLLEYDSDGEDDYLNDITISDDDDSTNAPPLLAFDGAARKNEMVNSKSDEECEC